MINDTLACIALLCFPVVSFTGAVLVAYFIEKFFTS